MIFFLLIIFPFLIPLVYFIDLRLVFSLFDQWYWLLLIVLLLDFAYFCLLYFRNKSKLKWLIAFFLHSIFFISSGFAFILILADDLAINIFSVLWPLLLVVFLYSLFHYSYETSKLSLIDIKNIIPYINVASFFAVVATLINVNIFLALPWWVIFPIFIVASFVFNLAFILLYESNLKMSVFYSAIITLIMAEIMAAMLYLPTSFYALGAVVALIYYLIVVLLKKKLEGEIVRKGAIKHFVFVAILLVIILATSQWM